MLALHIIFWTSVLGLAHTYLAFPLLLRLLTSRKRDNTLVYHRDDSLPSVSVIIPAHNESAVIREKLQSVLASSYPAHLLSIVVGSDASTDTTDAIVRDAANADAHRRIRLVEFSRRGKPSIVNELVAQSPSDVLVLTDANVMFTPETLFELVKHFKNPAIALVESNMQHRAARVEGIGLQESAYLGTDARTKRAEGLQWGTMMGPSGGCFALRRTSYAPVPANFLVDDFYINMKVLAQGGRAIYEQRAVVVEDVGNIHREEFRRKVRIATGDFQNLRAFAPLLLRFDALAFTFFSHKVLRWIGPILLLSAYLCCIIIIADALALNTQAPVLYAAAFIGLTALFLFPVLDWLIRKLGFHVFGVRMLAYFCSVNLALLVGLGRFLRGVDSGAWNPTARNQ